MLTKKCTCCGNEFAATTEFFYVDKRGKYGLFARCKPCFLAKSSESAKRHPRDRRAYNAAYGKRTWVKRKAWHMQQSRAWREKNREKRLQWEAEYRKTDRYRSKNRAYQNNRRVRVINAEGVFTPEEFERILVAQNYRCFYCGCDLLDGAATVDHFIPISKGGSNWPSNLRGSCLTCNISKGTKIITENKSAAYSAI